MAAGFPNAELRNIATLIGAFDEDWYRRAYPDVAASGKDPFWHYMRYGWRENRRPSKDFNIESYAARWPEFRSNRDNPILHLLAHGLADAGPREHFMTDAVWANPRTRRTLPEQRSLKNGLSVVSHFRSEIGIGQAARNVGYACDAARLPVSFRNLPLPGRENDLEFSSKCNSLSDRKASLLVLGLGAVIHQQHEIAPGRLNILFPFWELARIPSEWHAAIRKFDEVWAPSRFVASAFEDLSGIPIHYVPQPVLLPAKPPEPRPNRTTLRFFTYLDFDSFVERKNPKAAIAAFRAAFAPTMRDVELVVKTRGALDTGQRRWLEEIAAPDTRIRIVDRTLDRAGMDAMMAESDAFISLHRSEGFGFGPAEALAAGKAAVATDYSSTSEFINAQTGYPVACTLEPVRSGEYVHTEGQVWANPNLDAAVEALRAIYDNPAEADARARRGFALLQERHSLANVGGRIAQLLDNHGLI
jgi:glycosyltransferase involved in cell wall biosynthesis